MLARLACNFDHTDYGIKRILVAIKEICMHTHNTVEELSSTCCLSKKQFEREFNTFVGMNPKEYIRIVRLQKGFGIITTEKELYQSCANSLC